MCDDQRHQGGGQSADQYVFRENPLFQLTETGKALGRDDDGDDAVIIGRDQDAIDQPAFENADDTAGVVFPLVERVARRRPCAVPGRSGGTGCGSAG